MAPRAFPLSCRLAISAALLAAGPAAAEPWACAFTVACTAADGCTDSTLTLDVIAADHAGDLFASSAQGDSPVTRLTAPGTLPASYAGAAGTNGFAGLLTIRPDSTALMTRHLTEGTATSVTYFGTCEAMT